MENSQSSQLNPPQVNQIKQPSNISQDNISQVDSQKQASETTKVDDTILQERDRLIKFIKGYIKKNNELP